jgi:hypothetical protein
MAGNNDKYRLGYGASNYTPDRSGLGGLSFGRVGDSVRDFSSPGRSFGSGVGATLSLPMKRVSKKKGGTVKKMAKGGSTASKRADGCATKGKTKGKFV